MVGAIRNRVFRRSYSLSRTSPGLIESSPAYCVSPCSWMDRDLVRHALGMENIERVRGTSNMVIDNMSGDSELDEDSVGNIHLSIYRVNVCFC